MSSIDELKLKGNKLYKKGNFAEAVTIYTKCILQDPSNPVLYMNRSFALYKLSKFQNAVEDCNKALSFNGDREKLHFRRAMCLMEVMNYKQSLKDIDCVLSINPSNSQAAILREDLIKKLDKYYSVPIVEIHDDSPSNHDSTLLSFLEKWKSTPTNINMNQASNADDEIIPCNSELESLPMEFEDEISPTRFSRMSNFNLSWNHASSDYEREQLLLSIPFVDLKCVMNSYSVHVIIPHLINALKRIDDFQAVDYLNKLRQIDNFKFVIESLSNSAKEALQDLLNRVSTSFKSLDRLYRNFL